MNVVAALEELAVVVGNVSRNATHSLKRGKISKSAARQLEQFVAEREELSQHDHEVIEHVVDYVIRVADHWLQGGAIDHDEHHDDLLDSAVSAARSKSVSESYNLLAGRPVGRDDAMMKQLVIASVNELQSALARSGR